MADYRSRVAGLLYDEGGLSKSALDTTAARNPVPDGTGHHTNKGITWAAFAMLGPRLGYKPTPELFYRMPKDIWMKIYKIGFWDAVKGDEIKSQAIADMIVDIAFNAGPGRAAQLTQRALNRMGHKPALPENTTFGPLTLRGVNQFSRTRNQQISLLSRLREVRIAHWQSLSNWETFKNGWMNRVDKLYREGLEIIKKNAGTGIVVFALAFGSWYLYQKTQA
jgi:lysozyme family protein